MNLPPTNTSYTTKHLKKISQLFCDKYRFENLFFRFETKQQPMFNFQAKLTTQFIAEQSKTNSNSREEYIIAAVNGYYRLYYI